MTELTYWSKGKGNRVSVKRLTKPIAEFLTMLQKLQQIDCPYIVRYFEVKLPFIVMEDCGVSFRYALQKIGETEDRWEKKFDPKRPGLHWIATLAQGLQVLHKLDIVHGDFEAGAVLLGPRAVSAFDAFLNNSIDNIPPTDLDLKIVNFESRRNVRTSPPECLMDDPAPASKQTDSWNFAFMCWEVFSLGGYPWYYLRDEDVLREKLLSGDRPPLTTTGEGRGIVRFKIPDDVTALVTQCWSVDPNARATADMMVESLKKYH